MKLTQTLNTFRNNLNLTAACFILIGTFCDFGTFYYSKNVQIFDEDLNDKNEKELQKLNVSYAENSNKDMLEKKSEIDAICAK